MATPKDVALAEFPSGSHRAESLPWRATATAILAARELRGNGRKANRRGL